MTPHELGTAALMGDIKSGEIHRDAQGELFVELQDLCLSDDGCYFTTIGGSRIAISRGIQALSTVLATGAITVIRLPGAFIKAVAE